MRLLAAGKSNNETARSLTISLNTVQRHVSNIFESLAVSNRVAAANAARNLRLLAD